MAVYGGSSRPFLSATLIFVMSSIPLISAQTGVHLSLNGQTIPSDGYVLASDIGVGGSGLLCNTVRSDCCRGRDATDGVAQGHWYLPDGTQVGSYTQEIANDPTLNFFSRDRGAGVVRLNRQGAPSERGRFRCEVPNADGDIVAVFVNIVDMIPTISMVSITPFGGSTAGESYSLRCTVTVTGSAGQPTITWLDPMDNMITSEVETTGSMSTLTFNPLAASHNGTYTCRATLGSMEVNGSFEVIVKVETPTTTEAPTTTELPTTTESPTTTEAPTITEAPTTTESPTTTEALTSTESPTTTEALTTTESPTTTEAPTTTELPAATELPTTTEALTTTVSPTTTEALTTTMSPTTTESPTTTIETTTKASTTEMPSTEAQTTETSTEASTTEAPTPSIFLSLNNVPYMSSVIPITVIGETNTTSNTGLQCLTDRRPCCSTEPNRQGDWLFPDGTAVPGPAQSPTTFYRNRGDDGTVNLNRLSANVMMPTGQFCCRVRDTADTVQTVCVDIVNVVITPSTAGTPTAGETYSLDCSVSGTSNPATYQWFDNNGTQLANTSELQFSPLRVSDAGMYTCRATVEGVMLEGSATVNTNLPAPENVKVTYPMRVIAGSHTNLTCTVELSPAIDVPVNVSTEWSGPERIMFLPDKLVPAVMVNITTYTSTVAIDAARNGSYTCQATISSGGMMSGSASVSVAPLPAPTNLMAIGMTTSIRLTWEQPEGSVNSYILSYQFTVNQCSGNEGVFPPVQETIADGSLREYTIENGADTPVEEDSMYSSITLRAMNTVDTSEPSNSATANTMTAAPGPPPPPTASSVSVTSITIQWDPIPCRDRNQPIDNNFFYRVTYHPLSDLSAGGSGLVGVNSREYTATGLPPRTSYVFRVQAFNLFTAVQGSSSNLTFSTSEPQDVGFLLGGQLYGNNSVVTVTDIGSSFFMSALFCLTPSLECCSDSETPNAASVTREWYLPNGTVVSSAGTVFSREQVSSAVALYRSEGTSPSGVFRCEIPDASRTSQNIFIGIYPQGDGSLSITSVLFDRNSTTLTCTSTGGPPTTITWRKNGIPVNVSLYEQSQRLVDAVEATYQSILFNNDVTNFVGAFTCEVSNVRVTAPVQETVELNGVFIVRDEFSVGESVTASCKSDAPASMIEWLRDGVVVESAAFTGIQELDLVFSPVNDSIHTQVYVCRVTRDGENGMTITAVQNFTVNVDVPSNAITATVSSSGRATAGMVYSLTCNVSKTVGGLTDSPTAVWTTGGENGGVVVTNGNGITVSGTIGDMTVTSTLTFDPLRTSHEGSFVCSGTLTSPALDTALMPSTTENLEIQISTPDVVITVPPGPLFAGRIAPLTLNCTISINSATDTRIEISDMDITWLRGNTRLSSDDPRVTISSVTGSRPSFTSTLTLDPLSTADNTTFTCRARARPPTGISTFVMASEVGGGAASVIVDRPSPPTVSINPFNRLETAGEPLTLNCSASIQEGIRGTPDLTWTREDASLSSDVTSAPPLLSFPSLRTSHAGRYTCTARLYIPEAGVDIPGDRTTNVSIQFMPPPPIISGSPRNTSFFQGLDLTLTCSITLGDVVDTPVTVQGIWNRNETQLMDGDENGRIIIVNHPMNSLPYDVTLRFNLLNVTDAGTYECDVTIIPQDATFISTATTSNSRAISVSAFPTQFIDVTAEGISTAGFSGYTLICNTSREPDLPPTSTLAVEWLDPRGNIISSGENFTISAAGPTTDVGLISRLVFNNLYTSQGGVYTCRTFQTIPGIVRNHPELVTSSVRVKLPAPISPLTFRRSRNTTLNAGTSFSLTCIITPNTTGVDTEIMVESSIMGNGISDTGRVIVSPRPVSVEENTFETTVTFSHLLEADAGAYNCSAFITSPPSLPNVIISDSTSGSESISVGPLQAPTVSVSPIQEISIEAGGQDTLTCTALFDEYLVERPTLVWEFPQGSSTVDTTMGDQLGVRGTTTRTLTFNRIRTSQAGVYTCRATIDIQGINSLSQTDNQTVQVEIPRPMFSVLPHPTAYNGTNLTIMGRFQQNSNVDTDITISGTWSGGTSSIVTTTQIMLSLLPVATNSSGEYTITYTIRSSENSPHIIEYSGEDRYNLAVEPLPSRSPTISIVSRRQMDGCGEVMTLNCTATQVENLFSPPTIVWVAPDGSEVPTVESRNPRMNPQTRELIFSDITPSNKGQYTCRSVVDILQAEIDDYTFGIDTVQVNTESPGEVRNLVCAVNSLASELSFSWDLPTQLDSEVVSYQVIVNGLEHRPGTREVIQSAVDEQFVDRREAFITGLFAEVPYNITVKALNLAGCGEERQIYCFTQEGEPPQPTNVVVTRVDDTTMMVTWDKLTLVELKGLANYTVTYSLGGGSRKRQAEGVVTVPWTENSVTIGNLQSGAAYSVTVGTITSAGMSSGRTGDTLEALSNDPAAIVGGVIAAILFAILVILVIIIVLYVVRRRRVSKFSPGHMYDTGAKASTEERELQPLDNGSSQPAISEKEKEALEESAIVPPPTQPRSAITTEVLDRMKPVSQASFRDHVAEKHEDRDKGFEAEYQSFGTDPVNSHEIAKLPINRPKNRFANIFPYDHSRVKLNTLPGEEGSDYINACSLDGYKRQGCYIAAQGPMPNTISDFWRMIWEKRLPNIVMLTKCLEAGRRKCEQYWADNIGEDYQTPDKKLNITTTSVMPYADFSIRTFSVKSLTDASLDPLSVTQYHFTSWPDHGVPKFATSLISFIRRVQRGHTKDSGRQLLVHCSAGVGRTGTLITLDSMLDRMAAKEPDVNVYEFVFNMRQRRVLMVQTLAQYVFIHDALNELITCGQTDIVASALRTKVNFLSKVIPAKGITGFQNQFQLLEQVSRLPADEDLTDAMEHYNQSKNRYPDKIPYNMSRARLRPTGEDGSEYINASFIDGYKQRNAYIATQGPLQNTVNDVWRMLYEFKSRTLVMLCNMNEDGGEASYPFFPSKEEEPVKYGKMLVTLQSKASYTDFIVRKFSIQEDKQGSPKNDGFVVTQFHLTEWPPRQVPNTGTLIEMLDMVTKNQMSTGNRPITVMCNDGVGRTGTFICIHAQLERLKTEGVVDFFQSIKSARIQRAGLVPDVDQYAFCHTVLADYIDKFDNYANFKDMIM